jgi:hypothetical protein
MCPPRRRPVVDALLEMRPVQSLGAQLSASEVTSFVIPALAEPLVRVFIPPLDACHVLRFPSDATSLARI